MCAHHTACCLLAAVSLVCAPQAQVLQVLGALTSDPANEVWVISGRSQQELGAWFESVVSHWRRGLHAPLLLVHCC